MVASEVRKLMSARLTSMLNSRPLLLSPIPPRDDQVTGGVRPPGFPYICNVYAYTYVYIYMYTHTHTHTHIHKHVHYIYIDIHLGPQRKRTLASYFTYIYTIHYTHTHTHTHTLHIHTSGASEAKATPRETSRTPRETSPWALRGCRGASASCPEDLTPPPPPPSPARSPSQPAAHVRALGRWWLASKMSIRATSDGT